MSSVACLGYYLILLHSIPPVSAVWSTVELFGTSFDTVLTVLLCPVRPPTGHFQALKSTRAASSRWMV